MDYLEELTSTGIRAHERLLALCADSTLADVKACVDDLREATVDAFADIGVFCGDPADAPAELDGEWGESSEYIPWLALGWEDLFEKCSSRTIREAFGSKKGLLSAAEMLDDWSKTCERYGMDDDECSFRTASDKATELAASWVSNDPAHRQGAAKRRKLGASAEDAIVVE